MMRKLILVWVLCSLTSLFAQAQDIIVTKEGDTLKVFIVNDLLYNNESVVTFRRYINSTETELLTPQQTEKFYWFDRTYLSKEVKFPDRTAQLFVKVLITGEVTLYTSVDEQGRKSFYVQKTNEAVRYVEKNRLNGFIKEYFTGCEGLDTKNKYINDQEDKNYREDFMSDLVSYYNACAFPDKHKYERYMRKSDRFSVGLKAGAAYNQFGYSEQARSTFASAVGTPDFDSSVGVLLGVYFRFDYSNSFSLNMEGLLTTKNTQSNYDRGEITFRYTAIEFPVYLKYEYAHSKWKPFINVGGSLGFRMASDYRVRLNDFTITTDLNARNFIWGYLGGIGMAIPVSSKRNIIVEGRYLRQFVNVDALLQEDTIGINSFQLHLAYRLF